MSVEMIRKYGIEGLGYRFETPSDYYKEMEKMGEVYPALKSLLGHTYIVGGGWLVC